MRHLRQHLYRLNLNTDMGKLLFISLLLTIGIQLASTNFWCVPGWNATCNYRGTCNPATNTCQCNKLPFRCGSQTKLTDVFDFNNRCDSITHGCFYELNPGGEVSQHLCSNRGCCASLSETGQGGIGYACKCNIGYIGRDCEKKDPCYLSSPGGSQLVKRNCSDHGTCQPSPMDDGTALCTCEFGYSGQECENEEAPEPEMQGRSEGRAEPPDHPCWYHFHPEHDAIWRNCSEHGSCVRASPREKTNYTCECQYGYWGRDCQYADLCKIDETGTARPQDQPCNGGFCRNVSWGSNRKQAHNSFVCECSYNQLGKCCEFLNPCIVNPCQDGGVCSYTNDNPPVRKCKCKFGYSGDSCENRDPCTVLEITGGIIRKPRKCNHRGKCSVTPNGMDFICTCKNGFWGKECDFANLCIVDESGNPRPVNKPCNGGTCHNVSSGFPWWTDEDFNCEFPDPCIVTPCKHGGTCSTQQPDPNYSPIQMCKCPQGYVGQHCEHLNPCTATPCKNGATCTIDLSNQSKPPIQICQCPDDVLGQRCEYKDPCKATPCQNAGTCSFKQPDPNKPPIQTCKCPNNYVGEHCEIVNPCYMESPNTSDLIPRECNKRGNCSITGSGTNFTYDCNCRPGYWFKDCQYTNLCQIDETGAIRPPNEPCNGGTCRNHSWGSTFAPPQNSFDCECDCNQTGQFCQFPNPCKDSPCQNGGNCTMNNQTDPNKAPTRNCTCPDEYVGETCNKTSPCYIPPTNGSDPAVPRNCNNRGECMVVANGTDFVCNCSHGFWGSQCNFTDLCKVNHTGSTRPPNEPCDGVPCRNSSTEVSGQVNDTFKCDCPNDKVGEDCQFPNPCITSPCQNGGNCIINNQSDPHTPPTRNCTCPNTYVGETCDSPNPCFLPPTNGSDPTVPRDCNNHGNCVVVDHGTNFDCNCTKGYWGSQCNFTNLCIINENGTGRPFGKPCNGGSCNNESITVNGIVNNSFTCTCPPNKLGQLCQFTNPCTPSPCKNGGNCTINNYTDPAKPPTKNCTCRDGYVEETCRLPNPCYLPPTTGSDPTVPRDCNNRGECMVVANGTEFVCNCTQGFWGPQCNFTDLCKIDENGNVRPPSKPCNGGACHNASVELNGIAKNNFTCTCEIDAVGQLCQFPNPCVKSPCQNGGNCTINNHTDPAEPPTRNCTCPDEYVGETCAIPNPCYLPPASGSTSSVPRDCNNRGNCSITGSGTNMTYDCNCQYGYWSKDCNHTNLCQIDETGGTRPPDKPCNGGTCKNESIALNGMLKDYFTCTCPDEKMGEFCQFPNPCTLSPCQNGGNCTINFQNDPNTPPTRNCTCRDGYVGETCHLPNPCYLPPTSGLDPTVPRDCNNRGECIVVANGTDFVCNCSQGFWGAQCNFTDLCKIDENGTTRPPEQPCNGGTCRNSSIEVNARVNDTFTCDCPNDKVGQLCQFPNPCTISPCQNGGNCVINNQSDPHAPPTRNCTCPNTYVGETCDSPNPCFLPPTNGSDPTVPRDCNNQGNCVVVDNGTNFDCNCTKGYWGSQCNFTDLCIINENGTGRPFGKPCNSGACHNQSMEVNGVVNNTFTCICPNKTVGQLCQFPNPCFGMPCEHGGMCSVIQPDSNKPPIEACNCTYGFVGPHCEHVNPCTATPCQNGGACSVNQSDVNGPPLQNCKCLDGYIGWHCEFVNPCSPGTCHNGGTCVINRPDPTKPPTQTCNCTYGFVGKYCQFVNPCTDTPCQNGGNCTLNHTDPNQPPIQNCTCPEGFVGKRCEHVDPCVPSPCLNGGICTINNQSDPDKAPTYNCTCPDTYVGDTCNKPSPCYLPPIFGSDPTVPRDCNQRGDCMVANNGTDFVCNCSLGYWGPQCNFTNLCIINENGTTRPPDQPCNGGTCNNESIEVGKSVNDTFTCLCPNDKVGEFCQFPNPCTTSPCQNGGNCSINIRTDPNAPPTRNCTCRDGYVGETCHLPNPCYLPPTSGSDPTVPRDCNNRGECMVVANGTDFVCNCSHGFWGSQCNFTNLCIINENGTNRPSDQPCNGGICRNSSIEVNGKANDTFTCSCPHDKVGQHCQFPNPCVISPCQNGGNCTINNQSDPHTPPTRNCTCPDTYVGETCNSPSPCYVPPTSGSDPTVPRDCNNRGECMVVANGTDFVCNCSHGFWGSQCNFTDLCKVNHTGTSRPSGQPCNGGACHNSSIVVNSQANDTFTCSCPHDKVGPLCQFPNPCIVSPCQNGGYCTIKNQTDSNKAPTRNCTCPDQYVGETCNKPSPCYIPPTSGSTPTVPRDCNNRGDCLVVANGTDFVCNCSQGFWGAQCNFTDLCKIDENGITRPPDQPCNGGACRNSSIEVNARVNDTFTCDCPHDKVGQLCQFPNPCTISPCQNGGNCVINNQSDPHTPPTRNCTCPNTYVGETCGSPSPCYLPPSFGSDPTVPRDCNNRGDCIVVANGTNFVCNCSEGFWGAQCNFTNLCKIDSNGTARPPNKPCNGGECRNESVSVNGMVNNTFTCNCSNDAVGQLCQFPNPCFGMPCKNGGTCKINQTDPNQKPTKNCTCPETHIGENCQITNPCYFTSPSGDSALHECNGRGNCSYTSNQNNFICNCQHGFWGKECEFINLCLTDADGNIRAPDKPCNDGSCYNMSCWVNTNKGSIVENTFTCKCPPNRLGMFCEFVHPCHHSPCINEGICQVFQPTMASVPSRICSCRDGYFGDRCEQINPCYFNSTYCKNSAFCVREDNYTLSCNCSRPYFEGDQCEAVNLCKAPVDCEIFNGGIEYCNPCKNGGECIPNFSDPMNVRYTCNCNGTNYGGQFCEHATGKLLIIPEDYDGIPTSEHVDSFVATAGQPHNYFIVALFIGDEPTMDFYTGDGFSLKLQPKLFRPVDQNIPALSAIASTNPRSRYKRALSTSKQTMNHNLTTDPVYFLFPYSYSTSSCPDVCKMTAVLRNFGIVSSVRETIIRVTPPPGIPCVPNSGLRNVGHFVNEAPEYKRTSRFVVEANLKFECFEDNWLDPLLDPSIQLRFEWALHKLSYFFPAPCAENDWHVERLTPVTDKYLVFEPHVLVEGFYWVECRAIVRIGDTEYGNSQLGFFKIVQNPPRIILKESTVRYVDGDQEILIDASGSIDDSFPEHTPYLKYTWTCESPCAEGPWEGPILRIPEKTFRVGDVIKIRLNVKSNHAGTSATEFLTLHIGSQNRMSVRCVRNCEKFNPGDEVVFECIYEINGIRQPVNDIELEWLPPLEITPTFNVEEEPYMTSVVLPVVKDPTPRAIICRSVRQTSSSVSAQMEFRINMPPMLPPGGACFITPYQSPKGPAVYLVTRFRMECNTRFVDPHVPLRYSFYAQSEDIPLTRLLGDKMLLNYDTNPKTEEVFLPLGSYNRNPFASWRMKVILKVTDDLGLSTELSVYTYIKPPDMGPYDYPTLLENLIYADRSLMKRRFLTGDNQGVLQLQMVVAYGLNTPSIINTLTVAEQYQMLSDMENTLIRVPLHSFKITEQKITAAHFVDHIEDRPETEVLTEVSLTMFQSASQMVEFTKQGDEVVSSEQVDSLARASADSSSRLLRASYSLGNRFYPSQPNFQMFNKRDVYDYHTDDNVGRDYYFEVHDTEDDFDEEGFNEISENVANEDVKKYAKVSHHALFAFERVMNAAVENLGYQSEFFTNTDKVGLHAEVLPNLVADYTAAASTADGTKTEVMIPKDLHDILKDKVENDLELQITEVTINPFYDDSSANPHTPVVNLVLKDSESHVPVLLEDLPYPLDITLFFTPPPSNALDGARTEHVVEILPLNALNEDMEVMIFKLDLPYDTKVNIEIDKVSSTTMIFKIIALKDQRPTFQSMCSYPLLDVVSHWPRTYQASFSTETLGFNETTEEPYLEYYIGIIALDPNGAGTKQTFRLLFTRLACLHRDEDRKFWSEEGCIVNTSTDPNANQALLHCSCRHASILTGVQFIAPHYLETTNILDFTLEEIQKNPVVLITVCTMLVIYLIGLIICVVYDKRDREKNFGLTIMADLRESNESRFYLITIVTGCNFWAGTTSTVSLILYGSSGRSKTYTLRDESLNVFRRGGVDTFLVSSDKDLGDLEKIRIWIDYSGSDPAWFCRRILVRPLDDDDTKKWYFYIHQWFTVTDKSATIIMETPATTRPERKMFSARFRENFMEQIDNVNLWFSIFRYSPAYTFTRCQRLSCAFAVLTSYLLISIMFYGMLTEDENGFYEVGEFTFDIYAIIKSFQVVILSLPFGVLIITLFRYILAQYIPTLIIWKNAIPAKLSLENKNLFIPKTNEDRKNYLHSPPRKRNTDSDVKIEFDSDEEENIPLPKTIRTGVPGKDIDTASYTSSKSNFSIPSTDIPLLEEWIEDRTKQYPGYTAKLVGAASSDDDEAEEEYPDKFITTLDEVDEEDRLTNRLNRLGRLAIIHSLRDYDPDTFIFQGDNDIPQIEALIDEQIKWKRSWIKQKRDQDDDPELSQGEEKGQLETVTDSKKKSEFKKAKKTPWKDAVTTEYLEKIDQILDEEVETRHKLQNQRNWKPRVILEICLLPPTQSPRCSWPYWFVVVAWIVCLLTIFLTCYFTLLYGLHYGYLRSVNWLHSYIRSFLMSVLIVQPLNAVIAAFLSTLFGKDQKVCERVQVIVEDYQNTSEFLESRLPYKFTVFQATLPHQPLSGPEIFRLTIAARRKHELRDKLLRLVLCVLLLIPLIAVSYSGHNKFDYDITENVRNMLQLNNLGDVKRPFRNEDMVYKYMEKVLLPNLHPEKWYNGQLIPQPTPINVDNPAVLSDLQTFLIGVARVRQQRVKPSACIEQDQIAIGKNFRCNAEYKKITQDQESYNPSWDPVTGTRLPSSLTNDAWEFHGKDSRKTLSFGYTGNQAHYDGGGYILELGRTHRESESVLKFMRTHHWLDHRTRAVFIELTLMNPNINKFVDVVLMIEQSATWAFTMKSWISPITLIPIEDFQESNDLIWVALNIIIIVTILIILFCLFMAEAFSSQQARWLTSPRFWFDMTIILLALTSLCISIARFISAKEVSDVIERQRIDEYVSVQRAAYWYQIEGLAFSITQTVVFIKIWKLIMFTDRRFLSFALTLKLTAGFLLGFLIILSIFLFAFAFAGHFLFGQVLWEFSTLNESLITLVDQILGVSLFDEFAQANPILGPVYAFLFGFLVVFIGLNFVVALLDLGVHEAKEVVSQRKIWLTYTSYFVETLKKSFPIFQRRFKKEQMEFADTPLSIPPHRMQGMKDATAAYLRQFLSLTSDKMKEMETHCNKVLAGTGYRMVNKQEKGQRKELEKQQHIDHMRAETVTYIKDKIGYDMKPDEMKKYADFNKEIVKLRIKKMEMKMEELSVKVDELVDSFI